MEVVKIKSKDLIFTSECEMISSVYSSKNEVLVSISPPSFQGISLNINEWNGFMKLIQLTDEYIKENY